MSRGTAAYVRLSAASRLAMADATGKSNITGSSLKVREPLVVTAERIANFCIAVGETNPLYLDPAAAAAGPHRRDHRSTRIRGRVSLRRRCFR